MTVRNSFTSNSDGRPWAAITAAVFCLVFELAVAALYPKFRTGLDYTVDQKRQRLMDSSHRDDVAIFGDSRFFSIRPDVVSEALGGGLEVTNYSWPFAGVETIDYVWEAYVYYKQPPKMVFVGWMPENLAVSPQHMTVEADPLYRTRMFRIVPGTPLAASLFKRGKTALLWDYLEYRLLPASARHRERFLEFLTARAEGGDAPPNAEDRRIITGFQEHGSFILYPSTIAGPNAVSEYERAAGGLQLDTTLGNLSPFERFLQRAEQSSVRVVLFNVPMPRMLHSRFEEIGVIARYHKLVKELHARFSTLEVFEPLIQVYPNEYFADVGHLNASGDQKFLEFYRKALRSL